MDVNKITLASYIVYLQGMYKRYGNISIAQLKHIERNRKKRINNMSVYETIDLDNLICKLHDDDLSDAAYSNIYR